MAKTTCNIKGRICGAEYDDDYWFGDWIRNGAITPASRPCRELDALNAGDECAVFIDSPGGDVFGGNAITIAARNAVMRGAKISVEIGARAFSMGANMVAHLKADGCKVACHANSILGFHSAFSEAVGGADAHRDEAKVLDAINAEVIRSLMKCGAPADCKSWFDEGRVMWLSAAEAKKCGLVDTVLETDAAAAAAPSAEIAARFAALLSAANSGADAKKEHQMNKTEQTPAPSASAPAAPAAVAAPAPSAEHPAAPVAAVTAAPATDTVEAVRAEMQKRLSGLQAEKDKTISGLTQKLTSAEKELAELKTSTSAVKAELEKAKADLAKADKRATTAQANLKTVTTAALGHQPDAPAADADAKVYSEWDAMKQGPAKVAFADAHFAELARADKAMKANAAAAKK